MLARQSMVLLSTMSFRIASIRNFLFGCFFIVSSSSDERMRHGRFFRDSRPVRDWDPEQNVVISETRAKIFLQEFGYMQKFDRILQKWEFIDWKYDGPSPAKEESQRSSAYDDGPSPAKEESQRSSAYDGSSVVIEEDLGYETDRQYAIDQESNHNLEEQKLFHEAVKKFQKQNNIPVSGVVDQQTMKLFVRPRCGVPDNLGKFLVKNSSKILKEVAPSQNTPTRKQRFPNLHELLRTSAPRARQTQRSIDFTTPSSSETVTTIITAYTDVEDEVAPTTITAEPDRRRRAVSFREVLQRRRRKRSQDSNNDVTETDNTNKFNKREITWRIYSNYQPSTLGLGRVTNTIKAAFRMWAEVSPLVFTEDVGGDILDVDIKIAFATGVHLNDNYPFDPTEIEPTQYSHAFPQGDVHFNDNVHFTIESAHGISLLKTAVHEIGHVLGLPHQLSNQQSVMYPYYTPYDTDFQLHNVDRHAIKSIYGKCSGRFDSVFDWVRPRPDGGRMYNTFFFNNSIYWLYENRYNRTRNGDPSRTTPNWNGLPSDNIDAIVHVWKSQLDKLYFFYGSRVIEYDSVQDMAVGIDPATGVAPGELISDKFPGIPDNIDTAYFDKKDKNIYFFKNASVYVFDPVTNSTLSGYPKPIAQVFSNRFSTNQPLESNLDAAYYSYKHRTLFFFKGNRYWRNYYSKNNTRRRVGHAQDWNNFWNYICNVT